MLKHAALVLATLLMVAGQLQVPLVPDDYLSGPLRIDVIVWSIALAPLAPVVAACMWLAFGPVLSRRKASVASLALAVLGLAFTLFWALLDGAGGLLTLLRGTAITSAVAFSVLLLSVPKPFLFAKPLLITGGVATAMSVWSLSAAWIVTSSAKTLANGRPFCVAHHDRGEAVQRLADLRGLSFYTIVSGYKETSRWYFHGLLLISDSSGLIAYNWSPRKLRFDLLERPEIQFASPLSACTPRQGFWNNVSTI